LEDTIQDSQQELEDLMENILPAKTGKGVRGNIRLYKPEDEAPETADSGQEEEPENIYVFRISLKEISPQIWRSVQVPGSFTLGDFHDVIQIAMGWENCHLHSFEINNRSYGAEGDDDLMDYYEDDYTLDDLELAEKQRFLYTYDFGDDWRHQILVSKIIPAFQAEDEDKIYPLCLNGKRACPPEDIGGIYGYERILDSLKEGDLHSEMEWMKDYDSEHFDADSINRIFRPKRI
jgi:hypothetical protein